MKVTIFLHVDKLPTSKTEGFEEVDAEVLKLKETLKDHKVRVCYCTKKDIDDKYLTVIDQQDIGKCSDQ